MSDDKTTHAKSPMPKNADKPGTTHAKSPMPEAPEKAKPFGKPVKSGDNAGIPVPSKQGGSATKEKPKSHGGAPGAGKAGL